MRRTTKIVPRSGKTNKSTLNAQQRMFVSELLATPDFNLTLAAERAGYKSPAGAGRRLLQNTVVRHAVGKGMYDRMYKCEVSAERVLKELMAIAFFDPGDMFDDDGNLRNIPDMPEGARRALAGVDVVSRMEDGGVETHTSKVRISSKIQALELLAKHLGMLNEQIQLEHEIGPALLSSLLDQVEDNRVGNGPVINDDIIEAQVSKE